ncbi:MAG: MFS transporter [Steroidobacteraceae bacterium]
MSTKWGPGWYRELSLPERRTVKACVGGWALDAMDVQLYSFIIPTLMALWTLSTTEASALQSAVLVMSSVGGLIAGWLADRIGRVRTMQITIAWFAIFSFLSGLAQNYQQLFILRSLMGLGFGGEWAAGAVLLGETIRAQHRGKALGSMQAGYAVGWALALFFSWLIFAYLVVPQDYAWRAMFFVGITPAILVFFLRRFIEEPEVYKRSQAAIAAGEEPASVSDIFRPPLLRVTVFGGLLGAGAQGGWQAVMVLMPLYLQKERHMSVSGSSGSILVMILGAFCGYIVGAYLSDIVGRRNTFLIFAIGSLVTVIVYMLVPFPEGARLILGAPLGFFSSGVFSAQGAFLTEQFPTKVRGIGQGFTYNLGRILGALTPVAVGLLESAISLGKAIGLVAGVAYTIMAVAAFMLPETKGKVLEP